MLPYFPRDDGVSDPIQLTVSRDMREGSEDEVAVFGNKHSSERLLSIRAESLSEDYACAQMGRRCDANSNWGYFL